MPRTRAVDYSDKRAHILNAAADLISQHGYAGTSVVQIAALCNVSKTMLYHYFTTKEEILFEILQEHMLRLIDGTESALAFSETANPEELFQGFIEVFLKSSPTARARHVVAMAEVRFLTDDQKAQQEKLERGFLNLVDSVLFKVNPGLERDDRKVFGLLLIGMISWVELWYKPSGAITPDALYKMIAGLSLHGFCEVTGKVTCAPSLPKIHSSLL